MIRSDHEQPLATMVNINVDLWSKLEALLRQITEMNSTRESNNTPTVNLKIISEVHTLEEKMEEYSKYMEQSIQKLSHLEAENLVLREENSVLNTMRKKRRMFWTHVWLM